MRGRHYWYAVTSFILPDFQVNQLVNLTGDIFYDTIHTPILESSIVPHDIYIPFSQSTKLGDVLAVPNPYRVDQNYTPNNGGWETGAGGQPWTEQDRLIRFIHLPKKCTIRIFDLVGAEIGTIQFDAQKAVDPSGNSDPNSGSYDWPIFSSSNRALASGVYIFTVESEYGTQVGKFVVIR
ncbi:MAG TPA: T9SS type A sorting domain-containing protein [Bacteroidota bacterium]|nr:T9SS type A sorting domain-containing protein [Bacteroidota bacterium]